MVRPDHLADFTTPPLSEVVLGVQFSTPRGYQPIHAGEVWNLFKKDYPKVQTLPFIPPVFETFGSQSQTTQVTFSTGPDDHRYWFSMPTDDELLQFQSDRLLHNWRKTINSSNEYPRFEGIVERFIAELNTLERYFHTLSPQSLNITQCEVTYINRITAVDGKPLVVKDWLKPIQFEDIWGVDDFMLAFRESIRLDGGQPIGRLIIEAKTVFESNRNQTIMLSLTARGAPNKPTKESAIDFFGNGRNLIVKRFEQLTTKLAHSRWGRVK